MENVWLELFSIKCVYDYYKEKKSKYTLFLQEFGTENTPNYNFEYSLPLMERIKRQIPITSSQNYYDSSITDTLKDIVFFLQHGQCILRELSLSHSN